MCVFVPESLPPSEWVSRLPRYLERGAEEKPDDCPDRARKENHQRLRHLDRPDEEPDRDDRRVLHRENDSEQEQNPAEDQFEFGGHVFLVFTFKLGGHAPAQ